MLKFIRAMVLILLLAVLGVVATVFFAGGPLIRKAVNAAGPELLGVPVTLADAKFSPLQGRLRLTGLSVGNPEGFKTKSLFDLKTIEVEVDVASLLSDTIVIRRILVDAPEITYERGLQKSNIGVVQEKLDAGKPAPSATPARPGKKVVIEDFQVTNGQVRLSVTAAQGYAAPIALADIHLTHVGREEGSTGLSPADIVRLVLGTVLKSVVAAVGNVGEAAVEGVTAVGSAAVEGAVDGVKSIGRGIGDAIGGLLGGGEDEKKGSP